jgi:6-phosphogluconate dehydrogenase
MEVRRSLRRPLLVLPRGAANHYPASLQPGDLIIDGGNEWFPNSVRRASELAPRGIHFMGMGVSGGEEGARNGPSLMPGGEGGDAGDRPPLLLLLP